MNVDQNIEKPLGQFADWFLDSDILHKNKYNNNLYPYEKLFSKFQINQLTLKNRIMFKSPSDYNFAEQMGRPSSAMIDFYQERAQGGAGLIMTGSVPITGRIDPTIVDSYGRSPYPQIIDNESAFSGWAELVEVCHTYSAKVLLTLSAGPGQAGIVKSEYKKRSIKSLFSQANISASGGKNFHQNRKCHRLSDRKLRQLITNFGRAAELAVELGFDGVLIEGAAGEFLAQMSDAEINTRKFGEFKDHQSFALEIVRRIRRLNGPNFPIVYSIELNPKNLSLEFLRNLVQAGVDAFFLNYGEKDVPWLAQGARSLPPGYSLQYTEQVRRYLVDENIVDGNANPLPLLGGGKLDFPDLAEQALADNIVDIICLKDALLADPDWGNKVYTGKLDQIRPAIEVISSNHQSIPSGNTRMRYLSAINQSDQAGQLAKRIAVIGGGLAGIECAIAAHSKGHQVWLYDQENKIGGKLNKILIPNFRMDLANYLIWQQKRVAKLAEISPRFNLVLNTIATMSMLEEGAFDTIVVAVGGKLSELEIADNPEIIDILNLDFSIKTEDSLLEQLNIVEKNRIVILGEHPLALDIAYNLVYAYDKRVSLLFEGAEKAALEYNWESQHLLYFLKQKNVDIYYNVALKNLEKEKIEFQSTSGNYTLAYDFLFKATGLEPNSDLYDLLYKYKIAPTVYQIGDCVTSGSIAENINSGFRLGINL